MDQDSIVMADLMLKLADRFQKGLALNISHSAAYLDNGNLRIFGGEIAVKTTFDLIGNVGNHLNRAAAEIAPSFLLKYAPVYLSGGYIGVSGKAFVNKAFIVSQIQIRLCTVICHKYFAVLYRIHGAGVNINIGVEFLHCNLIPAGF